MSYTVLDDNLQVKGRLSLNNGQGNTTFFSDTITTQMATDNANDPAGLTTVDYTNQDKQGNAKQWSHTLTISVEATNLGTSINTTDYLMYFDSVADHYYLMKVINTSTDRNSGFITVSAINAAIFELGKQLIQAEQNLAQVDLKTFVSKIYKNAPFSLRVADDNLKVIDYVVSANTSLQALLQDLQTKYDVDVDSWVELDETGHIVDRVLYFGHLGSDNGELIRYGGAKGFENMTATEVSDIIYTKLYVTGKTDDKDATKGHIGTVNNGLEYITDDDANQLMYAIGASQQQPVYLEGTITNSLLSEPKALLEWAKQQIGIFNHPRFNYTVSPLHDQIVALGDTVTVQDFHIKPEILVTSKVIQKTVSFASPETNTFVLGEFSSIFTDNMNKSANVINLIKKDVTVVQAAADIAKAQADAAYQQAVTAQEKAIHAQTSADGKTTTYTVDSVQDLPQSANEGDIGWVKLSDGTHMYSYTDGKWVEKINPSMGADIDKKVSDVVTQAKDYSNKAIADNQVKIDESIKSVDDKANQLKQDQSALDTKAQGYANQALSDAKANTAQAVKDVTTNSQTALDQAKTDLTNGIAKEAADRQSAVNALDKTAQGYANQAKSDAISAATIADGVINKKIDDTASSITTTISQNKTDANGKIATAQSMAQQAVDGLTLKVSKTDYDQKTGDLSTKINDVKETADSSAHTIADIKTADGKQDARMSEIENTASGLKSTVSDLSTAQGKQSGDISTLQQRADGFDATVTKVNNLAVGSRNLLVNSKLLTFTNGNNTATTTTKVAYDATTNMWHITSPKGGSGNAGIYFSQTGNVSNIITSGQQWAFSFDIKGTGVYSQFGIELSSPFNKLSGNVPTDWTRVSSTGTATGTKAIIIYFNSVDVALDVYIKLPKLESGNIATDWTPAPEDVDSATAKAQLTADNAALNLSKYQTDADGRISKAQADIITNANAITQKVSQSDYNKKTGDLSTKVSTAQQTADQANTTIGNYQKSNDGRVTSAESAIKQNATNIASKVSQSDYNAKTGQIDSQISTINQNAQAITQTVSKVSDKVDNLQVGGRNLVLNSSGENANRDNRPSIIGANQAVINAKTTYNSDSIELEYVYSGRGGQECYYALAEAFANYSNSGLDKTKTYTLSVDVMGTASSALFRVNGVFSQPVSINNTSWTRLVYTFIFKDLGGANTGKYFIRLNAGGTPFTTGQTLSFRNFKLEQGNTPTGWTPAPEDTDSKFSQQQQTIDSINSTVQQQGTNINNVSTRVQTAEGNISTVQNNIKGIESFQRQTADGLSQEVRDRQSGDSTVLQQGKDFTTSQVSNSESNMRSLINQKADSTTIGVIQNDVATLKSNTQWQRVERFDDMNSMTQSGRFFIGASNNTNSAVTASLYMMVDAPQTDRITQTQWKDLDGSLMYRRTYNGSSWSPWTQMVMSSTLLNIFHDSWSLGTTTNDGITKQMVTGIMGQPDGTLVLKGNSLILDGNTTVTGDFYAKGGNFQNLNASNITFGTLNGYQVNIANVNVNNLVGDTISGFNFNVNKQMIIASGGTIKSDVVNMGSNSFYVNSSNIDSARISSEGFKVATFKGSFNISSSQGSVYSSGNISVYNSGQSQPYKNGQYGSEYNGNNILLYTTGYDNSDPNEFLNMSSAQIDISHSSDGLLSNATDKTRIRSNLIETTGSLNAFSGTQTPNVYSYPNLNLESKNQSVVLIAGGSSILQARENGYLYLLNRHSGSGGVSVQMATDGAFFMQSSATKYKEDIQYDGGTSIGDKFLTLDPATWQDKDEYEQRKLYRETGVKPTHQIHMTDKRYYGLIAEDLVKAGLEEFVVRDEVTGEVNGLEYDKVAISLIPVVREQRNAINELRLEVERLKQK